MNNRTRVESMIADGKSNSEISKALGITLSAVYWHASEKNRKYTLKKRQENKYKFVFNLKMDRGGRCCRCGYDKCLAALHFHHRDPREKIRFRFSNGKLMNVCQLAANKGKDIAIEESKKCDLICANCHAEEHWPKPADS